MDGTRVGTGVQGAHGGRRPHEVKTARILFSVHAVKWSQTEFGRGIAGDGQSRLTHDVIDRIESVRRRWQSV